MPIQAPPNPGTQTEKGFPLPFETDIKPGQKRPNETEPKSLWQLINLCIGFLGIQFAWSLQMGKMSPLLESLGSDPVITSLIWCAGPITGILVQPLIGSWSDRTWTVLGRRRPFLLAGALLTAISLLLMPNSPNLLTAAVLLWILDASINVSQGPYRALVPDVVAPHQQALTYSLMGFTIGLGSVLASFTGVIISDIHQLFYLGAGAMLVAMTWTLVTNPEPERSHLQVTETSTASSGLSGFIRQTIDSIATMPKAIQKLCVMHSFTWFGWQCLFIFFSLFVTHNIFNSPAAGTPAYDEAGKTVMLCYGILNTVCFVVSPLLGRLCSVWSKKAVHTLGLLAMAGGLTATFYLTSPTQALIAMGFIGLGWATTLSIPFAILSKQIPAGKEGVLMGTFNIFVAAPMLVASLLAGQVVQFYHNDAAALVLGGISVLISALLLQRVEEG